LIIVLLRPSATVHFPSIFPDFYLASSPSGYSFINSLYCLFSKTYLNSSSSHSSFSNHPVLSILPIPSHQSFSTIAYFPNIIYSAIPTNCYYYYYQTDNYGSTINSISSIKSSQSTASK